MLASTNPAWRAWFDRFKPWAPLTQGLKTEVGALNFVRLMARDMACSEAWNPFVPKGCPWTARNQYQRE